ncbi:uncharacterized protein [Dysidea avara]|uniref:uncharacterized protein n=1 Tax=Dysidea avara TaxID=196820 RepID=UPI0033268797
MFLKVAILLAITVSFTKGTTKVNTTALSNLLKEVYDVAKHYKSCLKKLKPEEVSAVCSNQSLDAHLIQMTTEMIQNFSPECQHFTRAMAIKYHLQYFLFNRICRLKLSLKTLIGLFKFFQTQSKLFQKLEENNVGSSSQRRGSHLKTCRHCHHRVPVAC